ncbi:MAG TPA: hypothetical protein VK742_17905 [Candidatus Sulfotelmatobacter sp.]|nr:hypothetical protein [Candidatus Sulfotelmatobacter sp.]
MPLTAATAQPERREFRVSVIQGGAGQGNFRSLAMPPTSALALPPSVAHQPGAGQMSKGLCEPRVTVQRDGKRVTHLHIQCTCGQTIDLACLYEGT